MMDSIKPKDGGFGSVNVHISQNRADKTAKVTKNDKLISRQAAIDAIEKQSYRHTYIDQIIDIINGLPSAEPERKTGRWIYDNEAYPGGNPYGHYDCDQCGESVPHKTNFCPNCGARMDGDGDG